MKSLVRVFIVFVLASVVAASVFAQTDKTTKSAVQQPTAKQPAAKMPLAKPPAAPSVQLKTDTAFVYAAIEMTGSYDQHSTAFNQLFAEAMKQGVAPGMPFGVYWNRLGTTPVEQLKWDVGLQIPAGKTVTQPLKMKKWEFTKMASIVYEGSFSGEAMANLHKELYQWIGENGYKPAGPVMRRYLGIPVANEKGGQSGKVEILVPVEKAPEKKTAK